MNDTPQLSAHEYSQRAANLLERGRNDHAARVLSEALAMYPDDPDLLYQSAHLDYLNDKHEAARDTLHGVLAREPEHFQARYLLASLYEHTNDLAQSELTLLDLIRDYPDHAALFAKYAMLMFRTHHHAKAKALAREALRLDPEDEFALLACLMGDLIDNRRLSKNKTLAEMMQRHPESVITAHMLVSYLRERGQYWAAKRVAVELLRVEPNSPQALALVLELEFLSHWSMIPLWPFNRWGVIATVGFYVFGLVLFNVLRSTAPHVAGTVSYAMLTYVIYSWVYPPILSRWLKRRAQL
ncbi:MAG: tetratricopeptide repeat protein [Pseudomonadota bacterium]